MRGYRYVEGVATLSVERQRCIGCGQCVAVCPHRLLMLDDLRQICIRDRDACMECGACARNCPVAAITVTPGVGCAVAILAAWINRLLGRQVVSGCC